VEVVENTVKMKRAVRHSPKSDAVGRSIYRKDTLGGRNSVLRDGCSVSSQMKCSTVTFGNAPNINRTDVFFKSFLCRHSYKLGRIDGNPIVIV